MGDHSESHVSHSIRRSLVTTALLLTMLSASSEPARYCPGDLQIPSQPSSVSNNGALLAWLNSLPGMKAPGLSVKPGSGDWALLEADDACPACSATTLRLPAGINMNVDADVAIASAEWNQKGTRPSQSGGVLTTMPDGSLLWQMDVSSDGGGGMRLEIVDICIPENAYMYWFTPGTVTGFAGSYSSVNWAGLSSFWTHTLFSSSGRIVLVIPAGAEAWGDISFRIETVAVMREGLERELISKSLSSCVVDASCYTTDDWPEIENVRKSIAYMVFSAGFTQYICTGGLLNDFDPAGTAPYFLTAHHCVGSTSSAESLECFWRMKTAACNVGFSDSPDTASLTRTLGADLLSTSATNDHTFLKLKQNPPADSYYLGWTPERLTASAGTELYRLSHPLGAPQAYSTSIIENVTEDCSDAPTTRFVYSRDRIGAVEGGSSGSPVLARLMLGGGSETSLVTGQLYGVCWETGCDICDETCGYTIDGSFHLTYPSIYTWLVPNDAFSKAIALTTAQGYARSLSDLATTESGEPRTDASAGRTLWWKWTPPRSERATVDSSGSDFAAMLTVFTGTKLSNLVQVVQAWSEGTPGVATAEFDATAGTTYTLRVDGVGTEGGGAVTLNWRLGTAKYTLATTVTPAGSGSVTLTPPPATDGTYAPGTVVSVRGNPVPGSRFSAWSGDVAGTTNPVSVTMNADKSIVSHFIVSRFALTVTANPSRGGAITLTPAPDADGKYAYGASVKAVASPAAGYQFRGWSGDIQDSGSTQTISMTRDYTMSARFEYPGSTLATEVYPSGAGQVRVSPAANEAGVYEPGTIVTISAEASPVYAFDHWDLDSSGENPVTTVEVNGAMRVRAIFRKVGEVLSVFISPDGGGKVLLDPDLADRQYPNGQVVRLTAVPADGYAFDQWSRDVLGTAASTTITMSGNKLVMANFKCAQPSAPIGLVPEKAEDNSVQIHWSTTVGAKDYMLYRGTSDRFESALTVLDDWTAETACADTGIVVVEKDPSLPFGCAFSGNKYYVVYYFVVARSACGTESEASTGVRFTYLGK